MSDKKPADKDAWMGILPDAERAEVLKTQIAEDAQTERVRIAETENTARDSGTIFVRVIVALGVASVAALAIYTWGSVHAPKPTHTTAATAPVASASAKP